VCKINSIDPHLKVGSRNFLTSYHLVYLRCIDFVKYGDLVISLLQELTHLQLVLCYDLRLSEKYLCILTQSTFNFFMKKRVAVISAKNLKRQRRKRQSITVKRGKSLTPKVLTAILTLPNLTLPNLT